MECRLTGARRTTSLREPQVPLRLVGKEKVRPLCATRAMGQECMRHRNPTWGQERIANELLLKLGIRISPRTVRKYIPAPVSGQPRGDQRWSTFLRNHAQAIVACDFFVAITPTFRLIYVFVVMHHSSRRLLHFNVTKHPTADWTLQQLRQTFGPDEASHYFLHDRDSIFSEGLNRSIEAFGLRVLKSPPRSPKANALCERLIGTIRRECLDWLIPIGRRRAFDSIFAHYRLRSTASWRRRRAFGPITMR
jgi:transposase InsO family protein